MQAWSVYCLNCAIGELLQKDPPPPPMIISLSGIYNISSIFSLLYPSLVDFEWGRTSKSYSNNLIILIIKSSLGIPLTSFQWEFRSYCTSLIGQPFPMFLFDVLHMFIGQEYFLTFQIFFVFTKSHLLL